MNKISSKEELQLCLELWEKQGGCKFGGGCRCDSCGAPYVLWKMMTGEVLHKKLSLEEWNVRISNMKDK